MFGLTGPEWTKTTWNRSCNEEGNQLAQSNPKLAQSNPKFIVSHQNVLLYDIKMCTKFLLLFVCINCHYSVVINSFLKQMFSMLDPIFN